LGVTGSVAAIRTPALYRSLVGSGHDVKVIATEAALYFFDPREIGKPDSSGRDQQALILDADEWPGRGEGGRYRRDDPVLHIELRRWADVLVIAPLDANTLAKLANGLCDNCLTCVWRAWDTTRPVILAPAMNTLMWEHPLTARHLRKLISAEPPPNLKDEQLIDWINSQNQVLRIVGPIEKNLACGEIGMGAMAEVEEILQAVNRAAGRLRSSAQEPRRGDRE
jgi:phosphopantothenoylcysteine decarboxylase